MHLLVLFSLLAAFLVLSIVLAICPTFPGEGQALRNLQVIENPGLTRAARAVSYLAGMELAAGSIGALIIVLWLMGKRRESIVSMLIPISDALVLGVKATVGRSRPDWTLIPYGSESASFPSGHAVHAVLLFGFLAYLCLVFVEPVRLRVILQAILMIIIVAVGTSRVYLGFHWPTDVVGGYIFGGFFLWAMVIALRIWKDGMVITK